MGIREERETLAAQFVSVRDLVEGLVELAATTPREVAGYLLLKLDAEGAPRLQWQDRHSFKYFKADPERAERLLRCIASWNNYGGGSGWEEVPLNGEFDCYGWFREEMAEFLKGLDITPPSCCSSLWKPEPKRPSWLKPYEHRIRLSINEAVCLLLGIDPEAAHPFGINGEDEEGIRHYGRLKKELIDALNYGAWDFDASILGADRDEQTILHSGIQAWAKATKSPWPFMDGGKAPVPESPEGRAVARELSVAKARIAELEKELLAIQKVQEQACNQLPQTRLMPLVIETYRQYWSTFDTEAPAAKRPTQAEILEWLRVQGLSTPDAQAVEKVACPFDRNPAKRS